MALLSDICGKVARDDLTVANLLNALQVIFGARHCQRDIADGIAQRGEAALSEWWCFVYTKSFRAALL